jgi:predicted esterase
MAGWNLGGWNRYYTKYADRDDVILVFPRASKQYNWMLSDDGFFMIPEMLKQIKKAINIDDNNVFIAGHSNGATGSFSYLMKQPTSFAGFYGFNTYPKVFTGGTFAENMKNRSFINFSTDEDYYYPPNANDDFTKLMKGISADYKEYRYNGFPHWFPQFDESEPAYEILFKI